jgi:anti-sigma factor RsiW
MTPAERPISEDEIHAYVDDRLERTRRREIEHYLDAQPELSQRVQAYRAQRDGLRVALASRAAEPIPPELNLSRLFEARLRQRHAWWRLAASMILCLALGGAAAWYLGSSPKPSRNEMAVSLLQQQALASHTVYATDRRHPIEVIAAERDHLTRWLSDRLRRSVAPPDLSAAGYRLLGGRLLATERDAQGSRLSVLMRPMAPELWAARVDISQGPMNGCTWIAKGMGYAVIAAASDQALDAIAEQISRQAGDAG